MSKSKLECCTNSMVNAKQFSTEAQRMLRIAENDIQINAVHLRVLCTSALNFCSLKNASLRYRICHPSLESVYSAAG
jgi:hypothetical protein